jgi:tRNA threonylcarbamoyladenosine biosynthesis protein TsaB
VILALESASSELSVALATPDGTVIGADAWSSAQRQAAELLPRAVALLAHHGHDPSEVGGVAVGTGPGSFTGLRVAMSIAKGLALALGIPIVGIPSLTAWLAAVPEADAALARAGAREAYVLVRGEPGPRIVDRDALPDRTHRTTVVAPIELAEAFELRAAVPPSSAAAVIAAQAVERLAVDPAGDDLSTVEPVYLRPPRGVQQLADEGSVRWL